jgi:hypothetical protein
MASELTRRGVLGKAALVAMVLVHVLIRHAEAYNGNLVQQT